MEKNFCYEMKTRQRLRVLLLAALVIMLITGGTFALMSKYGGLVQASGFYEAKAVVQSDVTALNPTGLFYVGFMGGLFFIPLPVEILYFTGLTKGNPAWLSLFLLLIGLLPAHMIDYWIGTRFSKVIMNFISKKKIYKIKRKVNKYGAYAIFFLNLIPAPTPILSFALGIAKYNVIRFYIFLTLGTIIKYVAIIYLYQYFGVSVQTFLFS